MRRLIASLTVALTGITGVATACPPSPCGGGFVPHYYQSYYRGYEVDWDDEPVIPVGPRTSGRVVVPNGNGSSVVNRPNGIVPNGNGSSVAVGPNGAVQPRIVGGGPVPGQSTSFRPNPNGSSVFPGGNGRVTTPEIAPRPPSGGGIRPNPSNPDVAVGPQGRTPNFFQAPQASGGGIRPNTGGREVTVNPRGIEVNPGGRSASSFPAGGGGIRPNTSGREVAINPGGRNAQFIIQPDQTSKGGSQTGNRTPARSNNNRAR